MLIYVYSCYFLVKNTNTLQEVNDNVCTFCNKLGESNGQWVQKILLDSWEHADVFSSYQTFCRARAMLRGKSMQMYNCSVRNKWEAVNLQIALQGKCGKGRWTDLKDSVGTRGGSYSKRKPGVHIQAVTRSFLQLRGVVRSDPAAPPRSPGPHKKFYPFGSWCITFQLLSEKKLLSS